MARSDLIVSLVRAGSSGDRRAFRTTTESIIAEERAKRHNIVADELATIIADANPPALSNGMALSQTGGSQLRANDFIAEVVPRYRLEDLVLPRRVRLAVSQLVEEQARSGVLRAHGLEPRHRILLVGPPGTGKTSLAEAIAEAIGVPLFTVRYETMIGSYLGETAQRLKRVFDYARTTPCVLFFDEFDAIGKERGDIHETGEIKRVVTSLLLQADALPSYTVLAAATNHPELLDRASWRRFQIRVPLPLPSLAVLTEFLDKWVQTLPQPLEVSTRTLATQLGRISFAEAAEFCLDVKRRFALSLGERSIQSIVIEQLRLWELRSLVARPSASEHLNGGTSAPCPACRAKRQTSETR